MGAHQASIAIALRVFTVQGAGGRDPGGTDERYELPVDLL
jgi:hypothetical protein